MVEEASSTSKKTITLAVIIVIILISASVIIIYYPKGNGPQSSNLDWAMLQCGPSHTGYSSSTAPDDNTMLWNTTGGGNLIVASGKIIICQGDGLVAIDENNRNILWTKYSSSSLSTPAVGEGIVVVTDDGNIYAYDENTGSRAWQHTISDYVTSPPTIYEGNVYVGGGGDSYTSDEDWKKVISYDVKTGNLNWEYEATGDVWSTPSIIDGIVYVSVEGETSSHADKLIALDDNTGKLLWELRMTTSNLRTPALSEFVFLSGVHYVGAVDPVHKTEVWNYEIDTYAVTIPTLAYGKVFVAGSTHSYEPGTVVALDQTTGQEIWSIETNGTVEGNIVAADGKVFVGCRGSSFSHGILYALDEATGEITWSHEFNRGVESLAIANGKVYASSDGIYCFYDGKEITTSNYEWEGLESNDNIWAGLITSDTAWTKADSPYLVTQDLTVVDGVTLTIEPGTIVHFDGTGTELIVKGKLDANGDINNLIYFTSNLTSHIVTNDPLEGDIYGDWGGLKFQSNETSILDYCNIYYAQTGIYSFSDAVITNCNISNCNDGFMIHHPSNLAIENTTIDNCQEYGIHTWSGLYQIKNTRISNCYMGIRENQEVLDNVPSVTHTSFYNCSAGIMITESRIMIEYCNFTECGDGILLDSTTLTEIAYNQFYQNKYGIRIYDVASNIVIHHNDFINPKNYSILTESGWVWDSVDATNNYWGSTDGTEIEAMISGLVIYSPWLNESPF